MDELVQSLIVIAATVIGVGVILWLSYRARRKKEAERQLMAQEQGWQYEQVAERLVRGYRYHQADPLFRWTWEALLVSNDSPGTSGTPLTQRKCTWHTSSICTHGNVVVAGKANPLAEKALQQSGGFQHMAAQMALSMMLGSDSGMAGRLSPVDIPSSAFRAQYKVWAHDPLEARALFGGKAQDLLLAWDQKKPLVIKLNHDGMELRVDAEKDLEPGEVKKLAEIGRMLVDDWKSARGE